MDSIRRKLLGTASAVALAAGLAAGGNAIAAEPIKIGMSMPQTGGLGGAFVWPSLLRKLQRENPDYAS